MPATLHAAPAPRVNVQAIEPDKLYPLRDFKIVARIKDAAFRTMRENGLEVRYQAGQGFVLGSDFIEFIATHGKKRWR